MILPLKMSVTENGLMAETDLTKQISLWNWHIIYTASHHNELPLHGQKKTNFLQDLLQTSSHREKI